MTPTPFKGLGIMYGPGEDDDTDSLGTEDDKDDTHSLSGPEWSSDADEGEEGPRGLIGSSGTDNEDEDGESSSTVDKTSLLPKQESGPQGESSAADAFDGSHITPTKEVKSSGQAQDAHARAMMAHGDANMTANAITACDSCVES